MKTSAKDRISERPVEALHDSGTPILMFEDTVSAECRTPDE